MQLDEMETYAQCTAVLKYANEVLHTSFELQQLRGRDFQRMRLKNKHGTILLASLEILDKVCVGILAIAKEFAGETAEGEA